VQYLVQCLFSLTFESILVLLERNAAGIVHHLHHCIVCMLALSGVNFLSSHSRAHYAKGMASGNDCMRSFVLLLLFRAFRGGHSVFRDEFLIQAFVTANSVHMEAPISVPWYESLHTLFPTLLACGGQHPAINAQLVVQVHLILLSHHHAPSKISGSTIWSTWSTC
jgi:hypothetical protein